MKKCFVIIGSPRTGTSLTTGVVWKMGAYLAQPTRKGRGNPDFYEHVQSLNYLNGNISSSDMIDFLIPPPTTITPAWCFKSPEPFLQLTKNLLQTLTRRIDFVSFIVTSRKSRKAIIKSFQRSVRPLSTKSILQRVIKDEESVDQLTRHHPRINLRFEDWFTQPDYNLGLLSDFTGLAINTKARQLINPKHRHF